MDKPVLRSVEYNEYTLTEFEDGQIEVSQNGNVLTPTIAKLRMFAETLNVSLYRKNTIKKTTRELGRSVISAIQKLEEKKEFQQVTNIEIIWPVGIHTVHGHQDGIEWTAKRILPSN